MKSLENLSSVRELEPESSVLYVVGTPIGNVKDISERSINLLSKVSFIACEDTKRTKKLLNMLGIKSKLVSFNEYNSKVKIDYILKELKEGSSIALVSDAGMPAISDPGAYLIERARKNNIEVICSPGPCAALTALVSSGLPSNYFLFVGFIPKKNIERVRCFNMIANNAFTSIVYESPKRVKTFLEEFNNYCDNSRIIHISKELTKKYEQHWRGSINKIREEIKNTELKGEFTIVIEGKDTKVTHDKPDEKELKKDLDELIKLGLKRNMAASYLSKKSGIGKNFIYNLK